MPATMRKLTAAAILAASTVTAGAQEWPARQVNFIVPFSAGGTTDLFGRLLAQHMQKNFGQPFIVENRAGAGGNLGAGAVARAAPDGYTFLVGTVSTHAINPFLYSKLPYDTVKDFQPVSLIARLPNILVVHPSLPVNNVAELIAYLKANPDKVNFGSSGNGSSQHISAALFNAMAGVQMAHISYRGGAPAVTDLLGGQVQVIFAPLVEVLQQVRAGKLRALGVTTPKRLDFLPDIPAICEFVPGYEAVGWYGVSAPKNTPPEIVDRLNTEINAALADPKIKERLTGLGVEPMPMRPAEFAAFIDRDIAKWAKVIKFAGIKPE